MKTPDTHSPGDRRRDDHRAVTRQPRRTHSGTIGFGQVFSLVKGGKHGKGGAGDGERRNGRDEHGVLVGEQPAPTAASGGAFFQHALESGSVLDQAAAGLDGAAGNDSTNAQTAAGLAAAQQLDGGRATPARAQELMEDVARSMRGEGEARELHLELEPAHLGPIIVKFVLKKGELATKIVTRDAGAAATLGETQGALAARLERLGFARVTVGIDHDAEHFAANGWVPGQAVPTI